jgi:crotonobetainyl-CoA:carnitine CoA-transferase CaiB-like acyl-CoA transferase
VTLAHGKLDAFGHIRTPIAFSRDRVSPFSAPALGEHGTDIARDLAGLSVEEIRAMSARGVFT